jgi:hypothetical protein
VVDVPHGLQRERDPRQLCASEPTPSPGASCHENGYEPPARIAGAPERLTFDTQQYTAAFNDACDRTAEFPYDELAHHGRRFLWPWQWG